MDTDSRNTGSRTPPPRQDDAASLQRAAAAQALDVTPRPRPPSFAGLSAKLAAAPAIKRSSSFQSPLNASAAPAAGPDVAADARQSAWPGMAGPGAVGGPALPLVHGSALLSPGEHDYEQVQKERASILKLLEGDTGAGSFGSDVPIVPVSIAAHGHEHYMNGGAAHHMPAQQHPHFQHFGHYEQHGHYARFAADEALDEYHQQQQAFVLHHPAHDPRLLHHQSMPVLHRPHDSDAALGGGEEMEAVVDPQDQQPFDAHPVDDAHVHAGDHDAAAAAASGLWLTRHQQIQLCRFVRDVRLSRTMRMRSRATQESTDAFVQQELEIALGVIQSLTDAKKRQADELAELREHFDNLHSHHDSLQREYNEQQLVVDTLRDERDSFSESAAQARSDLERAKIETKQAQQEVAAVREQLEQRDAQIASLEYRLTTHENSIAAMDLSDAAAMRRAIETLHLELQATRDAMENQIAAAGEATALAGAKSFECDQLNQRLQASEEERRALENRIEIISHEADLAEKAAAAKLAAVAVNDLARDPSTLEAELSSKDAMIEHLRAEIDELKRAAAQSTALGEQIKQSDLSRLETENKILKRENTGLHSIIERVKAAEAQRSHDMQMLESRNTVLQNEISELRRKTDKLIDKDAEIVHLSRRLESAQAELASVRASSDADIETFRRKLSDEKQRAETEHDLLKARLFSSLAKVDDAVNTLSTVPQALEQYPDLRVVLSCLQGVGEDVGALSL